MFMTLDLQLNPNYRIGEKWWEDKVSYSLVQEPHASRWQNAAEFSLNVSKYFLRISEDTLIIK